jgi:prepilin-type N-terminal cleavage/methylation domain-containing protein
MNGGKRPLGYTIIEVMIVLAVSGVMFIIAASFISGKQESTAFTEGANEFASQLQQTIAEVADGQYSDVTFTCTYNAALNSIHIAGAAVGPKSTQGTNAECDYLGKFAHFSENGNNTNYEVFSLAGGRADNTLGSAAPIYGNGVDLTDQETIPQSLQVHDMKVTDPNGNVYNSYGVGFVQSQDACANDSCPTNAQTIGMVFTKKLDAPAGASLTEPEAVTAITGSLTTASSAVSE